MTAEEREETDLRVAGASHGLKITHWKNEKERRETERRKRNQRAPYLLCYMRTHREEAAICTAGGKPSPDPDSAQP